MFVYVHLDLPCTLSQVFPRITEHLNSHASDPQAAGNTMRIIKLNFKSKNQEDMARDISE
jgi:hypothetical protein